MGLDDSLLNNNSFNKNISANSFNNENSGSRIDSLRRRDIKSSNLRKVDTVYRKMQSLGSSGRELQKKAYSKLQEIQRKQGENK